jgi:hypothetical protein
MSPGISFLSDLGKEQILDSLLGQEILVAKVNLLLGYASVFRNIVANFKHC